MTRKQKITSHFDDSDNFTPHFVKFNAYLKMYNCRVISKHQICIGGPQEDNGPKKRSRTAFNDEDDKGKEVQIELSRVVQFQKKCLWTNNPIYYDNNVTAGPGNQACREK